MFRAPAHGHPFTVTKGPCATFVHDKAQGGGFAAYEDGFSMLELTRNYYRQAGLDIRQLDLLIR